MSTAKLTVLDGSSLTAAAPDLSLPDLTSPVTGHKVLQLADSRASASLLGASLPEPLKSAARLRISIDLDDQSFNSADLSKEAATALLVSYLTAIADELKDNPVAASTLDGAPMRIFLDDEDDFAMLAENLFTDLDTEDVGKIQKSMVGDALEAMGTDFGIPPFAEFPMLNDILKKHGAEGEEEFGQAQFAEALQLTLQELANYLSEKPLVVILPNVKVNNGSKLRKLLANKKQFEEVMEKMLEEINNLSGKGNRTPIEPEQDLAYSKKIITDPLRSSLEKYREELGLPPPDANDAYELVHVAVFDEVCNGTSTSLETNEVEDTIKKILEKYAEKLEANPVMYEFLC